MNEKISSVDVSLKRENVDVGNEENAKRIKLETGDQVEQLVINAQNDQGRIQRKMIAILLAYCGQGYFGMQRNAGVKTIEEELLTALFKIGVIFKDQFETPQTTRFQRSCRTDKGVSAARQVVSLKAGLVENLSEKLNEHLPPQIRVFGYKRVTRSFNCKLACDARTYSYTLPTFAFTPIDMETNESYRIPDTLITSVNEVLAKFKGTHLFHNFTAGRAADDASAQRYIIDFECGQPFVKEGLEFTVITVKGQSFMLHQIRKMIGLAIAIVRGLTSVETIIKAWCPHRIDVPIAPGLGLVLEEVHYDTYNRRYGSDGLHETLSWQEYSEKISKFREAFIYPTIVNTEKNEKSMLKWLDTLVHHTFDVREELQTVSSSSLIAKTGKQLEILQKQKTCSESEQKDVIIQQHDECNEKKSGVLEQQDNGSGNIETETQSSESLETGDSSLDALNTSQTTS